MSISPLAEALRTELRRLLDGDEFSHKTCAQIVNFAKSARAMLQSVSGMPGAMDTLDETIASNSGFESSDDGSLTVGPYQVLSGAPRAETFGAKVVQELLAALPKLLEHRPAAPPQAIDPLALVRAIKEARDGGMGDVAGLLDERLRAFLGAQDPAPTSALDPDPSAPIEQLQTQGTVKLTPRDIAELQEVRYATAQGTAFASDGVPAQVKGPDPGDARWMGAERPGAEKIELVIPIPPQDDGILRRSDLANANSCAKCGLPVVDGVADPDAPGDVAGIERLGERSAVARTL